MKNRMAMIVWCAMIAALIGVSLLSGLLGLLVILPVLGHATVDAEAKFDRRGADMKEEIAVPFPEIALTIAMTTDADDATIEIVKTDLAKFCPISKVIRESGTKISEEWIITRP